MRAVSTNNEHLTDREESAAPAFRPGLCPAITESGIDGFRAAAQVVSSVRPTASSTGASSSRHSRPTEAALIKAESEEEREEENWMDHTTHGRARRMLGVSQLQLTHKLVVGAVGLACLFVLAGRSDVHAQAEPLRDYVEMIRYSDLPPAQDYIIDTDPARGEFVVVGDGTSPREILRTIHPNPYAAPRLLRTWPATPADPQFELGPVVVPSPVAVSFSQATRRLEARAGDMSLGIQLGFPSDAEDSRGPIAVGFEFRTTREGEPIRSTLELKLHEAEGLVEVSSRAALESWYLDLGSTLAMVPEFRPIVEWVKDAAGQALIDAGVPEPRRRRYLMTLEAAFSFRSADSGAAVAAVLVESLSGQQMKWAARRTGGGAIRIQGESAAIICMATPCQLEIEAEK